jgi:hypothetical protein
MSKLAQEFLIRWSINLLVCVLFACIPTGIALAFWYDDGRWLWLCTPILIFLS